MGTAIMGCAAVSADGYIAYDDGQIGSLFDWMSGGDVEWKGDPTKLDQQKELTDVTRSRP